MGIDDAESQVRQLLWEHTDSKQTIPYSELISLISGVYRQAIYKDLMELIGEEHRKDCPADGFTCVCEMWRQNHNLLRQELREKVKKYCE
jgi:hypothetical protein